jgi:hypothetical protein
MKIAAIGIAPALVLLLALGACQKGAEPEKGAAKAAGGDVLPGSVSDAMIDLDGATGTPPLQPAPKAKASAAAPEAAESEDTAPAAAEVPAAPAAVPAPAAQ